MDKRGLQHTEDFTIQHLHTRQRLDLATVQHSHFVQQGAVMCSFGSCCFVDSRQLDAHQVDFGTSTHIRSNVLIGQLSGRLTVLMADLHKVDFQKIDFKKVDLRKVGFRVKIRVQSQGQGFELGFRVRVRVRAQGQGLAYLPKSTMHTVNLLQFDLPPQWTYQTTTCLKSTCRHIRPYAH